MLIKLLAACLEDHHLSDLYITSAATPDNLANVPKGTYLGGSLFKVETDYVGKLEFETKFEF